MKKIFLPLLLSLALTSVMGQNILPTGSIIWADSTGGNNWTAIKNDFGLYFPTSGTLPFDVPANWTTENPYNGYLMFDGFNMFPPDTAIVGFNQAIDLSVGGPFAIGFEQYFVKKSCQTFLGFSRDSVNWDYKEINKNIVELDTAFRIVPVPFPVEFQYLNNVWIRIVFILNNFTDSKWILDDFKIIQLPVVRAEPLNYDTIPNNKVRLCNGDSIILQSKLINPPVDTTFTPTTSWTGDGQMNGNTLVLKGPGVIKLTGQSVLPGANPYSLLNTMLIDGDSINVVEQVPFDERIFLVSVDSATGKYLIVWKKTDDQGTENYNIYKATTSGRKFLGSIPITDIPVFIDETSEPLIKSDRYIITTIDKCGNEALYAEALTNAHRPMLLNVENDSFSGNPYLTWNSYKGFDFSQFIIFRGGTSNKLSPYDTVAFSLGVFIYDYFDETPLPDSNFYRIEVDRGDVLDYSKKSNSGPFSRSLSNLEDNRQQSSSIDEILSLAIKIYPNPMSQFATISLEQSGNYNLKLLDISGKVLLEDSFVGTKYELHNNKLMPGFYIINISSDIRTIRGNIIVQ